MECRGKFAGRMVLGGVLRAEVVGLYLDSHLALSPVEEVGRRGSLSPRLMLTPFSWWMLFTYEPALVASGRFYEVRGTEVGQISERVGHPGDDEHNRRPIRAYRLEVGYSPRGIAAAVTGRTEAGTSDLPAPGPLPPWGFDVRFVIPTERLQTFFHLSDAARDTAYRLLAEHSPCL